MTGDRTRVRHGKRHHIARVTLDSPDVLSAMNLRMHEELAEMRDDAEADDDIRVAVLTGVGTRLLRGPGSRGAGPPRKAGRPCGDLRQRG